VFTPVAPQFEAQAMAQVRAAIAKRQRFSPTDQRAIQMFGREQLRPIYDGITIGLQVLVGMSVRAKSASGAPWERAGDTFFCSFSAKRWR
jgi:hypothetical protein